MKIEWEKRVDGKKFEQFIGLIGGVQLSLEETQFEIRVRAEENLQRVRAAGNSHRGGVPDVGGAEIGTERGRVDRYVTLSDASANRQGGNPNSALSIELGRNAYDVTLLDGDGKTVTKYTVGAMGGTYILTDAADLPHKLKGGAKVKRHVKIRMKKGGRRGGRTSRRD
ncbi:hypothetical protein ACFU6R_03220 [Streptomyces sp. NPDC057499]|uniref:hypothetical protein n=1 Tax=Streptomyces sp. NPDC057499 TaxID=3346150 RepID=UPI0036B97679